MALTWSRKTLPAGAGFMVGYGDGKWVALQNSSADVYTSTDGTNWTLHAGALSGSGIWCKPVWNGRVWVTCRYNSTVCNTSPDGVTWTSHTVTGTNRTWIALAYSPKVDTWVVVSDANRAAYSTDDGVTWTDAIPGVTSLNGICWAPSAGLFVAVGFGRLVSTPDGITWTLRRTLSAGSGIAASSKLIVVTENRSGSNTIWTSVDGLTYTQQTVASGNRFAIARIAYGDRFMIASDQVMEVWTGTDGITWTVDTIAGGGASDVFREIASSPTLALVFNNANSGPPGTYAHGVREAIDADATIYDPFVGASLLVDHATAEGYDWVAHRRAANKLQLDAGGGLTTTGDDDALVNQSLTADQFVDLAFTIKDATPENFVTITVYLRSTAPTVYGWLEVRLKPLHSGGAGGYWDYGNDGGGANNASGDLGGIPAVGQHTLRVEAVGTGVDIYFDGVLITSFAEPTRTGAGYVGLRMDLDGTTQLVLDRFEAGALVQTEFPVDSAGVIAQSGLHTVVHNMLGVALLSQGTVVAAEGSLVEHIGKVVQAGTPLLFGAQTTVAQRRQHHPLLKAGNHVLFKVNP